MEFCKHSHSVSILILLCFCSLIQCEQLCHHQFYYDIYCDNGYKCCNKDEIYWCCPRATHNCKLGDMGCKFSYWIVVVVIILVFICAAMIALMIMLRKKKMNHQQLQQLQFDQQQKNVSKAQELFSKQIMMVDPSEFQDSTLTGPLTVNQLNQLPLPSCSTYQKETSIGSTISAQRSLDQRQNESSLTLDAQKQGDQTKQEFLIEDDD